MTALVRSELLKVRTVRSWWAYLIAIVLLAGLATVAELGPDGQPLDSVDFQVTLVDAVGIAALIGIILGIAVVTTEFRHRTITPTSLVEPHRDRVLAAKAFAAAIVAVGFGLLALAVIAVTITIWLGVVGADVLLLEGEVVERAAQGVLATVLWTLMGVAIGSIVHSQVAALVGTLVWLFLGETLLIGLFNLLDVEGMAGYLPFQALDGADGTGGGDLLSHWPGVGVSLGWIALIGAAGAVRTSRRDLS